jgi:phospholipase C
MSRKQIWKATCASIAVMGMLENAVAVAAEPILTQALSTTSQGASIETNPSTETHLDTARKIALLRSKVKYVFVLFQENRSFDHYFGTYPGANGLVSTFPGAVTSVPANQTSSYTQNIVKSTYDSSAAASSPRSARSWRRAPLWTRTATPFSSTRRAFTRSITPIPAT